MALNSAPLPNNAIPLPAIATLPKSDPLDVSICKRFDEKLKNFDIKKFKNMQNLELVSDVDMHGLLVKKEGSRWLPPICAIECSEEARPGYNSMKAHEYEDQPQTLLGKIKVLASLLRKSKNSCAYTGAGLSTSSGIGDYASKAKNSKSGVKKKSKRGQGLKGLNARPSLGHRALAQLWREGCLQNWIQQNHDGLPQKAGFPQHLINEIHGSWFDPSNPVVPMSGSLRSDLSNWHDRIEQSADLTIAIGTSLCGMSADSIVEVVAEKYSKGEGFGSVIIGLQRTVQDEFCSLRIFAKIDDVVALLAREMGFKIPEHETYKPVVPAKAIVAPNQYRVPYDKHGKLTTKKEDQIIWDLTQNSKVKCLNGPGKGYKGKVLSCFEPYCFHYKVQFPFMRENSPEQGKKPKRYTLGGWWVECCVHGRWKELPFVNIEPKLQKDVTEG